MNDSELLIYQDSDGKVKIDVRLEGETVWLTQEHMAQLFGKAKSTINEHIKNIFAEGELEKGAVVKKFGISEFQQKAPNYYNLDVIISVGYRVKSHQGTQFRIWATQHVGCGEVRTASIHIGLKSDAVRLAHRHPTVNPDSGIVQAPSAQLVLA